MADRLVEVVMIEIETPPQKTVYLVDESFDPTGMVVRAYYSNLTSSIVQFYTYSPTTPLTLNDVSITVSFGGKTDSLSITVKDRFYHQNIKGSNIGNNPYYNLFEQSVRFVSEPISINRDSYKLSFNLIYHSRMSKALSDLCLGLPERFKTNYHQFIVQDGTDSNSNPIYKFIDGEGYIHSFNRVSGNLYYSGESNLHLVISPNNPNHYAKIVDSNNNQLLFNNTGALFKSINGIDSNNIKSITFSNGHINLVKDDRKSNTYLQYTYDLQNRLSGITFVFDNQTIKSLLFSYNNNNFLTSVTEVVSNNVSRTLYRFQYNSNTAVPSSSSFNRVDLIEDCLNHKAYGFNYSFASGFGDYLVDCFKVGYIDNSDLFVIQKSLTRTSFSVNEFESNVTNEIKFIDHNDEELTFSIDKDANITATFGGSLDHEFKTLYNETGLYVSVNGDTNTYVNSHRFINVTSLLTASLSSDVLSFIHKYKYYVARFYLRLNNTSATRVRAICSVSGLTFSIVDINVKQQRKLQLVEIPFKKTGSTISNFLALSFVNENGGTINVDVGDIYIDKKAYTDLWFSNGQHNFNSVTNIKLYDSINQSEPTKTISITGETVFSKNDFLNSVMSIVNSFNSLYSDYFSSNIRPLYLNNGQNVETYGYKFALYDGDTCVFDSLLSFFNTYFPFDFWHFETLSPDDKSLTKTFYRYTNGYLDVSNKKYARNEQDGSLIASQEEIRRFNSLNGQLLKITQNYFGNDSTLTSVIDYEYFANGELKKATQTDNNETIVLYDATENNSGYLSRKTSGLNSYDIGYNGYLESVITHNHVSGDNIYSTYAQKEFGYDNYKSLLTSVAFTQSQINKGTNRIQINDLQEFFSINYVPIYKLESDLSHTVLTLSRYNGSSYDAVLSNEMTESVNETIFYDESNVVITNNLDSYGRVATQELNGVAKATFNYQNNIEHPLVAHLNSVTDGYINKTIYYYTDEANYVNQYCLDIFTVTKDLNDNAEYTFSNEAIYNITKENNILTVSCDNTRLSNFSTRYSYDVFNREINRVRSVSSNYSSVFLSDLYSYITNSLLPSSFQHQASFNLNQIVHVNENYNYDTYGNLASIQTTFRDEFDNQVNNVSYTRLFTYDGFNRLLTEHNSLVSSYSRSYSYSNDGKMEYFGNNYLSYNDNGQLECFGSIQFEYDNYGNRKTKTIGNNVVASYNYERGKFLSSISQDGHIITFTYDYLGRRYKKESYKEVVTYYYDGSKLIGENHQGKTYYDGNVQKVGLTYNLRFFYHTDGTLNGVRLSYLDSQNQVVNLDYIYIVNRFKEIVGITCSSNDSSGYSCLKVNYIYDAWGNHKVYDCQGQENIDLGFIGNLNPFRFKGYYYDQDTGLYYLLSRYYDPSIGQFVSPDDFSYLDQNKLSGYYLYAYCNNNPVMNYDPNGHIADWIIYATAIAVLIILFAAIDATVGAIGYWYWEASGGIEEIIDKSNDGKGIRIVNGFLLPGFFSKMVFLQTAKSQGKLDTERSVFNLTIEWIGHNAVSYLAFAPIPFTNPVLSLAVQAASLYLFFTHTQHVDLESSKDWLLNILKLLL